MDSSKSFPLVSVGVASYNNSKYIIETLNSILTQTYTNWELIIVDDCSADNSVDLIKEWIQNNNIEHRVKLIKNEVNRGVCYVFNQVVVNSSGKYLSTIGSDDIYCEEKLKVQVEIAEKTSDDVGVIYSDAYIIDENSELCFSRFIQRHRQFMKIPNGNIFSELIVANYIPVMTLLWKKACFDQCGLFDESLMYEDYDMLLRIARKYKFVFSEYISVKYRIHQNNLTIKLASNEGLRSDFDMLFKHVSINPEIDKIIEGRLLFTLRALCDNRSLYFKSKLNQFNTYFNSSSVLNLAAKFNIDYQTAFRLDKFVFKYLPKF